MLLSQKEIEVLLKSSQHIVEKAYESKLENPFGGDEYFKRGFLLACKELTKVFLNVLEQFDVKSKGGINEKK